MSWKGMDLVVRIVGDLKRYRADLREAGRDTQQAMGQAKAATDGLTAAQRGLEGQAGRTAGQLVDVGRAAASGDYARAGQQVAGMASSMSTAGAAAGGLGALLGAAAAAVGAYLVVSYKASAEFERQANLLALTGNAAGLVGGEMNAMARQVAEAGNTTVGAARGITEALVATGKVGKPALESVGTAIALVSRASGQSEEQVTGDFAKMADGVAKWAAEHNERYHFLTLDQYRYIKALEDAGNKQQAMKVVGEAFITHLKDIDQNVGYLQAAWRGLKRWASEAWDAMLGWGREDTLAQRIAAAEKRVKDLTSTNPATGNGWGAAQGRQRFADAVADLEALRELARLERRAADAKAERAAATAAAIAQEQEDEKAKNRSSQATQQVTEAERALQQLRAQVAQGQAQAQAQAQGLNQAQTDFLVLASSPAWKTFDDATKRQIAALFELKIAQEQAAAAAKQRAKDEVEAAKTAQRDAEVEAFFRQKELESDARLDEAARKASDKLREDERKAWEKTWDQVSESFTDALMEGGKSVSQYLKSLFRTLVLRPILAPVGAAFASMLGGPAAAGQGGGGGGGGGGGWLGGLGNLKNLLNPSKIFSSFGDSLAFAADSAGEWLMNNTSGMLNQLGGKLMGNAGSIGTIGSYAGGAMAGLGIGKAISGGYSAFGSSGNTAVNAGTIIGSIFGGPVGGAIGGTIGGVVNRLFGRKAPVTTSQGITGTFSADGANVQQYQDWFAKGGLFRSNKSGTNYSAVSSEMDSFLDAALAQVATTTRAYAELMSLNADALAGITQSVKINLQGMNAQQQEQEIAKALAGFGSRLAQDLLGTFETTVTQRKTFLGRAIEKTVTTWVAGPFVRAGETAGEALARLGSALGLTNTLFDTLGTTLFSASLQGAGYASSLVDAFGGLENLQNATLAYYGAYYSEQERLATGTRQMGAAMQALGLSLPSSRDGFRALVEAQDLTTEAGRSTYAALMGLAPAFAELTQTMEQLGSTVGDEVRRLRGLLTSDSSASLAALQAQFATGTAMARAGETDALARLPELSQAIEAAVALQAVTAADVALMRGQLAASLSETLGVLGLQVPAFAVGTNYVPKTMLAQVHEGEAIVPRAYNPAAGGMAPGGDALALRLQAVVAELQGLRDEVRSGVTHAAKTARILDRVAQDGTAFVTVAG